MATSMGGPVKYRASSEQLIDSRIHMVDNRLLKFTKEKENSQIFVKKKHLFQS